MKVSTPAFTRSLTYTEYKDILFELANYNGTTGPEQSVERIEATKINAQRVKRLDKTTLITEDLSRLIKSINRKWDWTVIMESWCGDGAQNVPIIAKVAALNDNINLKIILRDENPEIMGQYLTNGSRSIPILICTDTSTCILIGTWGSRPGQIVEMAKEYKRQNPGIPHAEFVKNLHLWYAKDKGESMQQDIHQKVITWKKVLSLQYHPSHKQDAAQERCKDHIEPKPDSIGLRQSDSP